MNFKIVSDSSSNVYSIPGAPYESVPLKILTETREFIDQPGLDTAELVEAFRKASGPVRSSCPNIQDWLNAFEGADGIFAITITSNLSGSYSAAANAAEEYKRLHPEAKISVIDSLSTGGEMALVVEKIIQGIENGNTFEEIDAAARNHLTHTHLLFSLKSLANLARNGRVSPAVAKLASILGICVVGRASDEGTLQPLHKCHGEKKALKTMFSCMKELGYRGGRVVIDHCLNEEAAQNLKAAVTEEFPNASVTIGTCKGLCSFYAEKGGIIVGFDDL